VKVLGFRILVVGLTTDEMSRFSAVPLIFRLSLKWLAGLLLSLSMVFDFLAERQKIAADGGFGFEGEDRLVVLLGLLDLRCAPNDGLARVVFQMVQDRLCDDVGSLFPDVDKIAQDQVISSITFLDLLDGIEQVSDAVQGIPVHFGGDDQKIRREDGVHGDLVQPGRTVHDDEIELLFDFFKLVMQELFTMWLEIDSPLGRFQMDV